jgi:hypothetical protein
LLQVNKLQKCQQQCPHLNHVKGLWQEGGYVVIGMELSHTDIGKELQKR